MISDDNLAKLDVTPLVDANTTLAHRIHHLKLGYFWLGFGASGVFIASIGVLIALLA